MAELMNRRTFFSKSLLAATAPLIAPALIRSVHPTAPPNPVITNQKIAVGRAVALDLSPAGFTIPITSAIGSARQ